jgi:hypothetical protein
MSLNNVINVVGHHYYHDSIQNVGFSEVSPYPSTLFYQHIYRIWNENVLHSLLKTSYYDFFKLYIVIFLFIIFIVLFYAKYFRFPMYQTPFLLQILRIKLSCQRKQLEVRCKNLVFSNYILFLVMAFKRFMYLNFYCN